MAKTMVAGLQAARTTAAAALLVLLALLSTTSRASPTCYDVNGQVASYLLPCNVTGGTNICCSPEHVCTNKGVCLHTGGMMLGVYGCTDPNWGSPCLRVCTGE